MKLISSVRAFINDEDETFRFILIISRNKYELYLRGKYIWTIEFNYEIVWEKLAVYYSLIS